MCVCCFGALMFSSKAGDFKANSAGKLCVSAPIIFAAIYFCIRTMLYCIWLSDNAVEVRPTPRG